MRKSQGTKHRKRFKIKNLPFGVRDMMVRELVSFDIDPRMPNSTIGLTGKTERPIRQPELKPEYIDFNEQKTQASIGRSLSKQPSRPYDLRLGGVDEEIIQRMNSGKPPRNTRELSIYNAYRARARKHYESLLAKRSPLGDDLNKPGQTFEEIALKERKRNVLMKRFPVIANRNHL